MPQLAVLLALLACAGAAEDLPAWRQALMPPAGTRLAAQQEFTFSNTSEPETLDPALITGVLESRLVGALFEGLLILDPRTLEPRPGVAERWDASPDGLAYVFHLREATWSDGKPLTADDFARAWRRVLDPKTPADYAYQLFTVVGAEDFHAGKAPFERVGIHADDAHTLTVRLARPCPWFLELCAFQTLMPTPVDLVDKLGDRWVRPENMVCDGPFRLSEWTPRSRIVLEKNPRWWDAAHVHLTKVTALPIQDNDTAYRLYLDGQLQWLPQVPQLKLDEARQNPDYYVAPYFGTHFYRFNCTAKSPFHDARVRRAFWLAVDRDAIATQVMRTGERPTGALCPPIAGYAPPATPAMDRDKARALMAEAGFPDGKGFPAVEILFNSDARNRAVAEALSAQWKAALGVQVGLRNSEWKSYLAEQERLDFQLCRSSWIGDYGDANTFYDMFVTDGGNNRTGWSSAEYDAVLAKSQAETDPAKRKALLAKLESILADECPIIPIAYYVNQGLLREQVGGWWPNIRDHHLFQFAWITE